MADLSERDGFASPDAPHDEPARPFRRRWVALAVGFGVAGALLAGLVIGRSTGSTLATNDSPVDLGFARDMRVHHAQGVAMASTVYRRTDDSRIRFLAYDILTTQQGQIGLMGGWLELWQQPSTDGAPAMAWMDEPHTGPMPGMAATDDVVALETLPVAAMNESFLRLMIRHHRGALPMADFAAQHAASAKLALLAQSMSLGQASEIEAMQNLLTGRGLATEPNDAALHGSSHAVGSAP